METGAAIDRYSRPKEEDERKRKKRERYKATLFTDLFPNLSSFWSMLLPCIYIYGRETRGEGKGQRQY